MTPLPTWAQSPAARALIEAILADGAPTRVRSANVFVFGPAEDFGLLGMAELVVVFS